MITYRAISTLLTTIVVVAVIAATVVFGFRAYVETKAAFDNILGMLPIVEIARLILGC